MNIITGFHSRNVQITGPQQTIGVRRYAPVGQAGLVREVCSKCGGTGLYDAPTPHRDGFGEPTCFTCMGTGVTGKAVTPEGAAKRSEALERAARRREEKRRAVAAERAALAAGRARAAYADWRRQDGNAEVADFLMGRGDDECEFVAQMSRQLQEHGTLSAGQVAGVRREMALRANPPAPVVEGRREVTGTVVSTKLVENEYGSTLKMLVEEDRGTRVWGTVPSSIAPIVERGARVSFTATVTRSDRDPLFGFAARPARAVMMAFPPSDDAPAE